MTISVQINNPPRNFYKRISNETGLSVSTVRNILKSRPASHQSKLIVIGKAVELLTPPHNINL